MSKKYFVVAIMDEDVFNELCSYPSHRVEVDDAEEIYKILSRDCRSDDTKEFVAKHDKKRHLMILYKKGKHYMYDRAISDEILNKKIISTGTSTYELQEWD